MEFSQSFSLGNSTFLNIEKNAMDKNALETIEESPTKTKKVNKTKNFSIRRKQKFQRTKSDSVLQDIKKATNENVETYSQFFKSDFSVKENINPNSMVNTSEVLRICENIDSNSENKNSNIKENTKLNQNEENIDNSISFNEFSEINSKTQTSNGISLSQIEVPRTTQENLNYLSGFTEDLDINNLNTESNWKEESVNLSTLRESSSNVSLNLSDFFDSVAPEIDENLQEIGKELESMEHVIIQEIEEGINFDESSFLGTINPIDNLEKSKKEINKFLKLSKTNSSRNISKYLENQSHNEEKFKVPETVSRFLETSEKFQERTNEVEKNTEDLFSQEIEQSKVEIDIEKLKNLEEWSLPQSIIKEYEKKGVRKMFPWQVECLCIPKVLFNFKNLVYSAPTSAGKTLVSEILIIKTILERNKKALMILPFVSVVREKMFYLSDLLSSSGYRVEGFFGGYNPPGGFDSINLAICTIEKANSIINRLMEQCKLDEIGVIVVDEIHLVSDPGRGYILELLLAKVLYMSEKFGYQIQIVTMSATLANVNLLTKWLNAELYITNFRPVQLQEMIKIGDKIYDKEMKFLRNISSEIPNDSDMVHKLVMETLAEGCSTVVFCPSKDWCEKLSISLAQSLHNFLKTNNELAQKIKSHLIVDNLRLVKARLSDIPTGLDSVLGKAICYGCAYHHAGLTTEERDIIEECFKLGFLKVIVATSTLSSGVNLPARRVIIRSPMFGGKQMNSLTYKQMIGRAGRTGQDTVGESILVCTEQTSKAGIDLITAELKPIYSCLDMESSSHLKRALLEVISSNVVRSSVDINKFVKCTLLNAQSDLEEQENSIKEALNFLKEYEFIRLQTNEETSEVNFIATRLGTACLSSSLPPADGLVLFAELQKSRRCFVLESELHAVYLVTPYSVSYQLQNLDWLVFLEFWEKLTPAMRKVGEIVGVSEAFLVKAMRGQSKLEDRQIKIHKRFYTALALNELVNEMPINEIATKYNCNRGLLQSLQQMASTFAGIVTSFCNSLNFQNLSLILSQFKERLFFGVHRDLIDLMRLPDINYKRARALFDGGIENLVCLANANTLDIENILFNLTHFETEKTDGNENDYEAKKRLQERNLFITGKKGMTIHEAAKMFIADARKFVQYEIGVGNIKWEHSQLNVSNAEKENSRKRKSIESNEEYIPTKTSRQSKGIENNDQNVQKPLAQKCSSDENQMSSNSIEKKSIAKNHNLKEITKLNSNIVNMKEIELPKSIAENQNLKEITKSNSNIVNRKEIESQNKKQNPSNLIKKDVEKIIQKSSPILNKNLKQTTSNQFEDQSKTKFEKKVASKLETDKIGSIKQKDSKKYSNKQFEANFKIKSSSENKTPNILDSKFASSNKTDASNQIQKSSPSSTKNACEIKNMSTPTSVKHFGSTETPKSSKKTGNIDSSDDDDDKIMSSQNQKELQKTQCSRLLRSHRAKNKSPASRIKPTTNLENHVKLKLEDRFKPSANSTESCINASEINPKTEEKLSKEPPDEKHSFSPLVNSTKLDITELSIENSIIKNPKLLNASHIFSVSKQDTNSSSYDRIDIVDCCGDFTLFKKAVEEVMLVDSLGMSLSIERLPYKIKNLIGGNLLINQIENEKIGPQFVFHINDESYLNGIAISLGKNLSLFFDLQIENNKRTLEFLNTLFSRKEKSIVMMDCKDQLKTLKRVIPDLCEFQCKFEDPKVANWLLQPDKSMNLAILTQVFSPECSGLINMFPKNRGHISLGMDYSIGICGKLRSSVEACVIINILKEQTENLKRIGEGELYKFFTDTEMPMQVILYKMENYGFPTSEEKIRKLYQEMHSNMKKLENRIYEVNGSKFQLGSSSAVAKVVGLHRKANGKISTSKQILEKIDSPISNLIVTYRKISTALSKNIQPLLKAVKNGKIYSESISFTSTGRISIHEPNLQNVAKDFEIDFGMDKKLISCRSVFLPPTGKCLISSDFCQLEMRVLAHLSQDKTLLEVMNSEIDIFKAIASKWHKIPNSKISEEVRNGTKQICYGIIYGMGMKSLADNLRCSEQEATMLSEQFHASYPGIRLYIDKVIKFCKSKGYVETITGRRRYLDCINSPEPQARVQSERQAVNSTIQGSAADLVKKALLKVEQGFSKYISKVGCELSDINFVLHVHDELIFEVPEDKAKKISKIIKFSMENSVKLSVPLKVKIKAGKSWGELKELTY